MAATAAAVVVRPVTPVQASLWSDAWRRLRRNRLAFGGAIYLTFLLAVALIALVWTPYPMAGVAVAAPYSGPSPGIPKMFSMITPPVMMPITRGPRIVTTGMSALRSAWRTMTICSRSPFARAVRM